MRKRVKLQKIIFSAMFLALAYVLPFFTGQIPEIGNMLCPMHLPVLICGFVCGSPLGLLVGITAPILRSLTIGMPTLFPRAIAMAFELAAYGFASGFLYKLFPRKKPYIYPSLIIAMVFGRLVWGFVQLLLVGFNTAEFGLAFFWTESVVNAIPGIIVQIILIPPIVMLFEKFLPQEKNK